MLDGTVELDETYVRCKFSGGYSGRAKNNKELVFGIRQRGGELRFFHAEDAKSGTLAKFIKENVSADVDVLVTDDFGAYPNAFKRAVHDNAKHKTINHSSKVYVQRDIHTNTVENAFSLLMRAIMGTWHTMLPETSSRLLLRKRRSGSLAVSRPDLFVDTLRHMVTADPSDL